MKRWMAAVAASFALVLFSVPAMASAPALVINDTGCGMPAADGTTIFFVDFHATVAFPETGPKVVLSCQGTQPASVPNPPQAVIWTYENTGRLCDTPFGVTDNWEVVISPSGDASFSCRVNSSSAN